MTQRYLWLKQDDGCDYTVGCGQVVVALGERSLADVLDHYGVLECSDVDEAYLLEVAKTEELNLEAMRNMRHSQEELEALAEAEAEERREYERLHAKYGDTP